MAHLGPLACFAALSGLGCVAFGAFVGHRLTDPQALAWARTAFDYHAFHTLAVFAAVQADAAGAKRARFAGWVFLFGVLVFCGSLYAMALGAPRALGMATPVGGISFLAGWALLAIGAFGARAEEKTP